jgi:hypothetical protein
MIYDHKQNRKSIFFTEIKIIKFITTKNLFFNTESSDSEAISSNNSHLSKNHKNSNMKIIYYVLIFCFLLETNGFSQKIDVIEIENKIELSKKINRIEEKLNLEFLNNETFANDDHIVIEDIRKEGIQAVIFPSYFEINDTCFVKCSCNYFHDSLQNCLQAKPSQYNELFIKTNKNHYYISYDHYYKKYYISIKEYLGLDSPFAIKSLFKLNPKYIIRVNRDLCYIDPKKKKWYFYLAGKLVEYKKVRKNSFPVHGGLQFLRGCKLE